MKIETIAEPYASEEARWTAVSRRDRGADGVFCYSVRTTGVYCRPSCGARPALRANVASARRDGHAAAVYRDGRPWIIA